MPASPTSTNSGASPCSFAPCKTELDCIQKILISLGSDAGLLGTVKSHFARIKGVKIAGFGIDLTELNQSQWRDIGETLVKALSELQTPSIICVDEMPVFVLQLLKQEGGAERTRVFLNWFRDLRQRYHKNVRWILAGSIGLDSVASRHRLGDTINDFATFPLGAFDDATADKMITKLAESYHVLVPAAARKRMVELIGWPIPYYLQLLFDGMLGQKQPAQNDLGISDVEAAFEALLQPAYTIHFDYWRQRLVEELGSPDDAYAMHILNAACSDPTGVSRETINQALANHITDAVKRNEVLGFLLSVLENDGYLVRDGERHRFRILWLRHYWKRRVAP